MSKVQIEYETTSSLGKLFKKVSKEMDEVKAKFLIKHFPNLYKNGKIKGQEK